jgi:hypothetical protein
MDERGYAVTRRLTCAICGEPVSATEAAVYLRMENALMHRACCHAHPSCHCYARGIEASAASTTDVLPSEQTRREPEARR